MYNINCVTIPAVNQRYNTLGDYWTEGGVIQFRLASFGDADYEFLVFVHECIEKQLARKMGITEQMIDAWDLAHEDVEEPGAMEGCPYREAHLRAEAIERVVAQDLGVDWAQYEQACTEMMTKLQAMEPPPETEKPRNKFRESDGKLSSHYRDQSVSINNKRHKPSTGKVKARSVLRDK
jgi:hypothetical protein